MSTCNCENVKCILEKAVLKEETKQAFEYAGYASSRLVSQQAESNRINNQSMALGRQVESLTSLYAITEERLNCLMIENDLLRTRLVLLRTSK